MWGQWEWWAVGRVHPHSCGLGGRAVQAVIASGRPVDGSAECIWGTVLRTLLPMPVCKQGSTGWRCGCSRCSANPCPFSACRQTNRHHTKQCPHITHRLVYLGRLIVIIRQQVRLIAAHL